MKKDEELYKQAQVSIENYHAFLGCLKTNEHSAFIEFVKAPIHEVQEDVVDLATYLEHGVNNTQIHLLEDPSLIRRFSSVRGTQKISAHLTGLNQKLKTLLILIERFIVYIQMIEDKPIYHRVLVKGLKERNSNGLFLKAAADFRTSLNKTQLTLMAAEDRYWLENRCYYHQSTDHTTDFEVFKRNIEAFELFNQVATLRNYLEILNRNIEDAQRAEQYDLTFNAIVEQVEKQSTYPVLIKLYIFIINILKTGNELPSPFYADFKVSFHEAKDKLASIDQLILVKACINHLAHVYYQLDAPWLKEMFEWMKYLSQNTLYNVEETISDGEYLNFYVVAQALGEMDVLADFEKKYRKYLGKEVKAQVLDLCKSYSLQREEKIDAALKLLEETFPSHSKKHLKYDIRAKELRVMLCYENVLLQKKWEEKPLADLERNIENLKHYCQRLVKREVLTEQTSAPHHNFQRVASKFHSLQTKIDEKKKKSLIKKIEQTLAQGEPISNRSWIKKQLALLGKKSERES